MHVWKKKTLQMLLSSSMIRYLPWNHWDYMSNFFNHRSFRENSYQLQLSVSVLVITQNSRMILCVLINSVTFLSFRMFIQIFSRVKVCLNYVKFKDRLRFEFNLLRSQLIT